jgi:hypothetical protein
LQPWLAHPLKGVRAGARLEGAASQQLRASTSNHGGHQLGLRGALDGAGTRRNDEAWSADLYVPDSHARGGASIATQHPMREKITTQTAAKFTEFKEF